MKTNIVRHALVCMLMLGVAVPGLALADHGASDHNGSGGGVCSFQGTWFGFDPLDSDALTGWMVTVAGPDKDTGTNNLEYPNLDSTLQGLFPGAVRISTLRGAWVRTGKRNFDYAMTGFALDALNQVVYSGKLTGHISLDRSCNVETVEGTLFEVFAPDQNPYTGTRMELPYGVPNPIQFPTHYGFRATVDMPDVE